MKITRFYLLIVSLGVILFPLHAITADSSPSPIDSRDSLTSKPLTEKAHKSTSQAEMSIAFRGDYNAVSRCKRRKNCHHYSLIRYRA